MEEMTNLSEEIVSLENASSLEIAKAVENFLDNKKGRDIKVLHVEDVTSIADYFVVCTATSNTHVKALSGEVEYPLERRGINAYHIEGRDNNSWILMDYSNVIVHVFSREARDFYNLDKLYGDSETVTFASND